MRTTRPFSSTADFIPETTAREPSAKGSRDINSFAFLIRRPRTVLPHRLDALISERINVNLSGILRAQSISSIIDQSANMRAKKQLLVGSKTMKCTMLNNSAFKTFSKSSLTTWPASFRQKKGQPIEVLAVVGKQDSKQTQAHELS
jgi:hypothetical protein